MNPAYTAALVGLGNIAWRFDRGRISVPARTHLGAFEQSGRVKVVCGYSPLARDREEFELNCGVPAFAHLGEIWGAKPDIVSICSPSDVHYQQTAACLEHAVPMVWLEKPPTLKLADLDALIRQSGVDRARTKLLVNYMRRYSGTYQRLRESYRQHSLGKPSALQVLYSRGLEANGSHFLDVVFSIRGDREMPEVCISDSERKVENPSFLLRFSDGFVVSFCGHATAYHINDVVLTSEDGRLAVLSGGLETRLERRTPNEDFPGFFRLRASSDDASVSTKDDPFGAALADLIRAHECDTDAQSSLTTARQTQVVLDRIRNA